MSKAWLCIDEEWCSKYKKEIECVYGDETIKYFSSDVVIDPSSVEA